MILDSSLESRHSQICSTLEKSTEIVSSLPINTPEVHWRENKLEDLTINRVFFTFGKREKTEADSKNSDSIQHILIKCKIRHLFNLKKR